MELEIKDTKLDCTINTSKGLERYEIFLRDQGIRRGGFPNPLDGMMRKIKTSYLDLTIEIPPKLTAIKNPQKVFVVLESLPGLFHCLQLILTPF